MIAGVRYVAAASLFFCATALIAAAAQEEPPVQIAEIASPAPPGSVAPVLCRGRNGTVWLTWLEPDQAGRYRLLCAPFDADGRGWKRPRFIASIPSSGRQAPPATAFAAADGKSLAAAWTGDHAGRPCILACVSADGGGEWSQPEPLSGEYRIGTEPALAALAEGRFLAAWFEHPPGPEPVGGDELRECVLVSEGKGTGLGIDRSVSGGSSPSLVSFLDGGALVAYRGLGEHGVRDILTSRFRHNEWDPGRAVNDDRWIPDAPPAGGPVLATDGGRVAAAWFTAADDDPRLLASSSPDAGGRFLMPLTVATGPIAGRPAVVLLHDNAALIFWNASAAGRGAGFWMRRVTPDFTLDPPAFLAPASIQAAPVAAIARDYEGKSASAQILLAFAADKGIPTVQTLAITIPEAALLAAEDTCHCSPAPAELLGYPIRGTIKKVAAGPSVIFLEHDEVPGILAKGTDPFRAAPDLAAASKTGSRCLARIERRNGEWWIFDVRLLVSS